MMNWQKLATSLYALCLFCLPLATAQTTIIDVCAKTKDPKTSLNVLAAPANANDDVLVRLENCALPDHLDLTISIPAYNGKSTGKTTISVRHVSAESTGSIIIKPDLTDPGSGTHLAAYGLMHNVEIDVAYAALHAKDGLLVVDTTAASITAERPYMMTAVTMRVFHSALRSDDGSIATFVTPHNGGVRNVNMYIGTNSTFKTGGQFIGSIVAGTVIDSKLIVNSGNVVGSGGSCDGGPVEFDAGSTSFTYDVGVLSVGMTRKSDNALTARAIKVQNLGVLVDDGGSACGTPNNIGVTVESQNLASFASLSVAAEDVEVAVSGFLDIRFVLSNRMHSTMHHFEASGPRRAAAVGSIVAAAFATNATTNLKLSSASVNIYCSVTNSTTMDETTSRIKAFSSSMRAAAVLGVATVSSPDMGEGKVVFTMDSSALVIAGKFINSKAVNMGATVMFQHSGTTVMGIVATTKFDGMSGTTTVLIQHHSDITIALLASMTDLVTWQAATVFGISCEVFSDLPDKITVVADFSVDPKSSISILGSIMNDPTPMLPTTAINSDGVGGTQSALGISVASHLGSSTTGGTKTANMYVKGSVTIDVSMYKTMVSTNNFNDNYFALVGVVVYGGPSGTLHIHDDSEILVSVNAVARTRLNARGSFVVTVGIRSNAAIDGMTASNTKLSFCKDTSVFPFPSDSSAIVLPAVSGVTFSQPGSIAASCVQQKASLSAALEKKLEQMIPISDEIRPTTATLTNEMPMSKTHSIPRAATVSQSASNTIDVVPEDSIPMSPPSLASSEPVTVNTQHVTEHSTIVTHASTNAVSSNPPPSTQQQWSVSTSLPSSFPPLHTAVPASDIPVVHNTTELPPPLKKRESSSAAARVVFDDNEAVGTVVLSSGGAVTAVASTLGTGGGGVLVAAGSAIRMVECGVAEDDPKPAMYELPLQFPVGGGAMRYFAGAAAAHTGLLCVLLAAAVFFHRQQYSNKSNAAHQQNDAHHERDNSLGSKAVTYLSMFFCGAHAFFTPGIFGACSTALNNDTDAVTLLVALASAGVLVSLDAVIVIAVHFGPRKGIRAVPVPPVHGQKVKMEFRVGGLSDSDESEYESEGNQTAVPALFLSGESTKAILLTLFDGCRQYTKATHRHYATVETTLFSVISIISGARPQDNCNVAAFAMGSVACLHLVYILVVRPFRTRLDTCFSIINAALVLALSVSVAITLQQSEQRSSDPPEWATKTMSASVWLMSVMGFVQLVVQCCWAHYVEKRRKQREEEEILEKVCVGEERQRNERTRKRQQAPPLPPLVSNNDLSQKLLVVTSCEAEEVATSDDEDCCSDEEMEEFEEDEDEVADGGSMSSSSSSSSSSIDEDDDGQDQFDAATTTRRTNNPLMHNNR